MKKLFFLFISLLFVFACEETVVAPEAMIKLTPEQSSNLAIPSEGEEVDIRFTSALDWTAGVEYDSGNGDWVRLNMTSGKGGNSIVCLKVSVHENLKPENRSANVVIVSDTKKVKVSIRQDGYKSQVQDETPVFRLCDSEAEVGAEGGRIQVTVEYNVDYKCEIISDWIKEVKTKVVDSKVHTFEISENTTEKPRTGVISFCGNDMCIPFTVNQSAVLPEPYLNVDAKSLSMSVEGGSERVNVSSNVAWKVECDSDWLAVSPVSGEGDGAIEVKASVNEKTEIRSAVVTVSASDDAISRSFVVIQEGEEAYFRLDRQTAEVEAEGGNVSVTVETNVEYSYEIPVKWIKEVEVVDDVHTFEIESNDDISQRQATISFCGNSSCLPFIITQSGKIPQHMLEVDRNDISVPASGTDTPVKVNVTSDTSWIVESDAGWCLVNPVSGIHDGAFNVMIGENFSSESRVAKIKVSSSDGYISREIAVIQETASLNVENGSWQNEEFIHKSLVLRFTADWCVYCPSMATALKDAQKELPDKIEAIGVHGGGSGLTSDASDALTRHYRVTTFPTGLVDGRVRIKNSNDIATMTYNFVTAVKDSESEYDVVTGASWKSTVSGDQVMLNLSVFAKESGTYRVTALLVEDDVVGFQYGESDYYAHGTIIRESFTDVTGDAFAVSSGAEVKYFNYSATIPDGCNVDNMRVVVYIQKQESNGDYYVDNSVSAAVGRKQSLMVKSDKPGGAEGILPDDDIPYDN